MTQYTGPRIGDALGIALEQCWNDGGGLVPTMEIFEFLNGWMVSNPLIRYFDGPEHWSDIDHWAFANAQGRVLDIGTGAGRFAKELVGTPKVSAVVGVDSSPGAVQVARSRGLGQVVVTDFLDVAEDLGKFDTILLLGNNLGLLGQGTSPSQVLAKLAALCNPGAAIIGTAGYPRVLPRELRDHNLRTSGHEGLCTFRIRHEDIATPWMRYHFLAPDDLSVWSSQAGWQIAEEYSGATQWGAIIRSGNTHGEQTS